MHDQSLNFTLYVTTAFPPIPFVVGSGPTCNVTQSSGTTITCTLIYADIPTIPMNPVINCTADGHTYSGPATKKLINSTYYVYDSTTVIQISDGTASTYDCRVTFNPPDVGSNPSYKYVATNHPNFTANYTGEI